MTLDPNQSEPNESSGGAEADWARWEETFRDARPVLPEVAIERIEAAVRKAAEAQTVRKSWYRKKRVWVVIALGMIVAVAVWVWLKT